MSRGGFGCVPAAAAIAVQPRETFALGGGDLLVMGGAAQHEYEHSVPKVAAAGPRMSVTFRHSQ